MKLSKLSLFRFENHPARLSWLLAGLLVQASLTTVAASPVVVKQPSCRSQGHWSVQDVDTSQNGLAALKQKLKNVGVEVSEPTRLTILNAELRHYYIRGDARNLHKLLGEFNAAEKEIDYKSNAHLIVAAFLAADLLDDLETLELIEGRFSGDPSLRSVIEVGRLFEGTIYPNGALRAYLEGRIGVLSEQADLFHTGSIGLKDHIQTIQERIVSVDEAQQTSDAFLAGQLEELAKSEFLLAKLYLEASEVRTWEVADDAPGLFDNASEHLSPSCSPRLKALFQEASGRLSGNKSASKNFESIPVFRPLLEHLVN